MNSENVHSTSEGLYPSQDLENYQFPPPPSYNEINTIQSIYQQPMVAGPSIVYVDSILPIRPNPPIYKIKPMVYPTIPRAQMNSYFVCVPQTTRMRQLNEQQIYLEAKYPTCFVIFHCIILLLMAAANIVAEFVLMDHNSFLTNMTSGWYLGGFLIGCAVLTLCASK